jgi:hypothetical protein
METRSAKTPVRVLHLVVVCSMLLGAAPTVARTARAAQPTGEAPVPVVAEAGRPLGLPRTVSALHFAAGPAKPGSSDELESIPARQRPQKAMFLMDVSCINMHSVGRAGNAPKSSYRWWWATTTGGT